MARSAQVPCLRGAEANATKAEEKGSANPGHGVKYGCDCSDGGRYAGSGIGVGVADLSLTSPANRAARALDPSGLAVSVAAIFDAAAGQIWFQICIPVFFCHHRAGQPFSAREGQPHSLVYVPGHGIRNAIVHTRSRVLVTTQSDVDMESNMESAAHYLPRDVHMDGASPEFRSCHTVAQKACRSFVADRRTLYEVSSSSE